MTPQSSSSIDPGTYTFSPRELQRLAVYRAAIVAHFYTDQCEASNNVDWSLLERAAAPEDLPLAS